MSTTYLQLTPHDPIIARDGRPFGEGQGNRMRGLSWPLPSVVAGSFRTALVKTSENLTFENGMPERLLKIEVAGVFPVHDGEMYLPAPNDAVAEPVEGGTKIKLIHRVAPQPKIGGCDFPDDLPLRPVMLADDIEDFKPAATPAWWPIPKFAQWLTSSEMLRPCDWFSNRFLNAGVQEMRDHVSLDEETGAAAESQLFTTAGLNVAHLPRFHSIGLLPDQNPTSFDDRFAEVTLSARVKIAESGFEQISELNAWHPLGGERRLVHWRQQRGEIAGWKCPDAVNSALKTTKQIRMVLATPAIFTHGWKPGWLKNGLDGELHGVKLKLVGVCNGRWKAVSGWSLAKVKNQPRGPKPIRRMVPAGSVYFFEVEKPGDAAPLAERWLQPVSDDEQERLDGFGLAVWGTW